jgi:hypothetical protein
MKGRNPKTEGRKKAETRRAKSEGQGGCGARLAPSALAARCTGRAVSSFGFRVSTFLRPSDLGLRTFAFSLWLLAHQSVLAATNSLAPDAIPPLRPPHAEIPPTFWEQHGVGAVVVGILLLALICTAAWFLTRPKPPVIVPPDAQARQALGPLRQQPEDGVLLSRVSQILRHYVAAAFDLPPGELTTAEFCGAIATRAPIGPELSAALSEFLRQCDQRKFSPPAPAPPFSAVAQALKLIDQAQARRLALSQPVGQPTQSPVASAPKEGIKI